MYRIFIFIFALGALSCQETYDPGTFAYDLHRLKKVKGIEVFGNGNSMVAVSGPYQARVFTSSATGLSGRSYGWFNSDLIENGTDRENMASLGGESRMWFSPDFGPYSVFHEPGAEQIADNIIPPQDLNNLTFTELGRTENSITYGGKMKIKNALDYNFEFDVERTIGLLLPDEIEEDLNIELTDKTAFVGFKAETSLENTGPDQYQMESGLFAIWELGCMLANPDNIVIIPLSDTTESITEYFTPADERLEIVDKTVFYRADAQGLNKIGIPPEYSKNVMGSYSPSQQLLNIVTFSFENDSMYVSALPEETGPYHGDVSNIFNGEVNEQLDRNWPFYEFESSSSVKELEPGEKMNHFQNTYHFEGEFEELDQIAKDVLGVSLDEIPSF